MMVLRLAYLDNVVEGVAYGTDISIIIQVFVNSQVLQVVAQRIAGKSIASEEKSNLNIVYSGI